MAAVRFDALARPVHEPPVYRCRSCRSYASRRFPCGVWYCTPCVPPSMRFPWETGYVAPAAPTCAPAEAEKSPAPRRPGQGTLFP